MDREAPRKDVYVSQHPMWTDDPLSSAANDTLGRQPYAHQAAELIHRTHTFDSSVVFGLSGPWGSGKSSLVNMIVEQLALSHSEWTVARFTPWATSDVTGLLEEFYSSLSQPLPKKRSRHVKRALGVAARVAAPAATLIPYAGMSTAEAAKAAADALTKSTSWQKAFDDASRELRKLKIPILVIVDDIDRLHGDELMALLKVVRLLGRFPGVQYLLAYDDETLFRTLSSANALGVKDGSAERFMEKIVQYPLLVPPLLQHQQLTRLNEGLSQIARNTDSGDARLSALVDCFVALLRTPRAIDRYVAQLRHHLPMVAQEEIDDEDVHVLTLIRVSFPKLSNAIPRYRKELLAGHTGRFKRSEKSSLEYERFDPKPLLNLVPEGHRDVARQLLVSLFPKIRAEGQISVSGSRTRRGVSNEEYFDRYFAMGIPAHDISDLTVRSAIRAASHGDGDTLAELLLGPNPDFRLLVLSKATADDVQPTSEPERLRLAEVLAVTANRIPDDDGGPFGGMDRTLTWLGHLLTALDSATSRDTVLGILDRLSTSALRIRTWTSVEYEIERRYRDGQPQWATPVNETLTDEAVSNVLDHLQRGDDAPAELGVGYQLHFALKNGRAQELRTAVGELLTSGRIDLSVLASRIVSARTIVGIEPKWELSPDFDQETFNHIAPAGSHPWYSAPRQGVDLHDLSWANRRRFVTGRVTAPPETDTMQSTD